MLLAGCSGHPNPDPAGADLERRARTLLATAGGRATVVRRATERSVVAYDLADLLCPDGFADGMISFRPDDDVDDGCRHLDADTVTELVRRTLGPELDVGAEASAACDLLVVEATWPAQERAAALLARLTGEPLCRGCSRHGR